MDHRSRRSTHSILVALLVAATLLVAACGTAAPSLSSSDAPGASASAVATAPSTSSPIPTAGPTEAPTPAATAAPTEAAACPIVPEAGRLASDRLLHVTIEEGPTSDLVRFVFDDPSFPDPPQGPSEGRLEAAEAPYTQGASGLPIELRGEHVALVRFNGMSLMNDVGEPTFDGEYEYRPDFPALRDVVNYDMSEGVVGWYIGYDGPGCVTLSSNGRNVTVAIDHG